jgi:anti-sigma factor RsiW
MTYEDIPCRQIVEMVTDYLEGALADENAVVVERHLAVCEGCAAYVEQMRATIHATGALAEEDIPPEVMGPLMEAFRELPR